MNALKTRFSKISLSLIVILVFAVSGYAAIDQTPIVGAWLFDEGSGTIAADSSGSGKDGSIKGGAIWVQGKFGKAVELNGTDAWVEVPSIGTFDEVTIAAWVMTTGRTGQWRSIIDNNGWDVAWVHHQLPPDNRVEFSINGNPGGNDQFGKFIFDDSQLNKWHHLATVYSDKTKKIQFYVDGQLDVETAWGGNPGIIGPARIGSWDGGGREWQGTFDEFIIFKVALAESDVKDLMSNSLNPASSVESKYKLATAWGSLKTQK